MLFRTEHTLYICLHLSSMPPINFSSMLLSSLGMIKKICCTSLPITLSSSAFLWFLVLYPHLLSKNTHHPSTTTDPPFYSLFCLLSYPSINPPFLFITVCLSACLFPRSINITPLRAAAEWPCAEQSATRCSTVTNRWPARVLAPTAQLTTSNWLRRQSHRPNERGAVWLTLLLIVWKTGKISSQYLRTHRNTTWERLSTDFGNSNTSAVRGLFFIVYWSSVNSEWKNGLSFIPEDF